MEEEVSEMEKNVFPSPKPRATRRRPNQRANDDEVTIVDTPAPQSGFDALKDQIGNMWAAARRCVKEPIGTKEFHIIPIHQ